MRFEHRLGAYMGLGNRPSFIESDSVLVANCALNFQISALQIYESTTVRPILTQMECNRNES